MTRDPVNITLNTDLKTCELEKNLLQGATNKAFITTLMSGEKRILLESSSKISVTVMYNPRIEYDKLIYDGSFVLTADDTNYDVTRAEETLGGEKYSIITIPFWEGFVTYAGRCKLIINITDMIGSREADLYSYSMEFNVDMNEGYFPKSIPNNLPQYKHLQDKITKLETDTTATEQKATDNAAAITRKADDNLANVGDFATAPAGSIIIKKNGSLGHEGITVVGENINAQGKIINAKRVNVDSQTLGIGLITEIHEETGFLVYHTNTLDKNYVLLDYETNPITGTKTPIYWSRLARERQTIQSIKDQIMQNVKSINFGVASFSRQVQNIYFDFLSAVNNLKIEVVINGKPLIYYPSKLAWDGKEAGYGPIQTGLSQIKLDPFLANLTDYSITFNLKADGPINLKGNGTIPYYELDLNKIIPKKVLVEGDVVVMTPEEIRDALRGLSGDERLGIEDLKNVEDTISGDYVKSKLEELKDDDRLDATAIKNLPSGGDTDPDKLTFRHSLGVKAMNKTGGTINARTFVMLSPKANGRFNMAKITKATGYHGEMIGIVESNVDNGLEGDVNLITNYQTGVTTASEGIRAYVGFSSIDQNIDSIDISTKDQLPVIFGKCGVFGGVNSLGEYMATFDSFSVQADYAVQAHHNSDFDYHDNLPSTIDKEALFVYMFDTISSPAGIVEQALPRLSEVEKGMQIFVNNKSISPGAKIRLLAVGGDKIDGASTFDVIGGDVKIMFVATTDGWIKFFDSSATGGGAVDPQTAKNTAELDRLKTQIENSLLPTYSFRNAGVPVLDTKKYKAYYIHSTVLPDSNQAINLPANAEEGTTFSIENNDRDDYLSLRPAAGDTINGKTGIFQCGHDTLNFFVKNNNDWSLAYGGVFPNSLAALKSTIQALLPNELNTITEIAAQLKDRLHTFREIQNEFAPQLNTLDAIEKSMESKGFIKEGGKLGMQADQSVPINEDWAIDPFKANEEIIMAAQNKGNQYLIFSLPAQTSAVVGKVMINNAELEFTEHDFVVNELHYKVFIADSTIDSSQTVRFKLEFGTSGSTTGIELDDGTENKAGVTKINLENMKLSKVYDDSGEVTLTADGSVIAIDDSKKEFDMKKMQSLDGKIRISNLGGGLVDLDADYQENTDSVFAKLGFTEDINTDFHDQRPYFGDVFDNTGRYIGIDLNDKAYTIQEGDMLDPNVTGGSTFNIGMYFEPLDEPVSSDDGYVELKVIDVMTKQYLLDIDGNPLAVRREYKQGDKIGRELLLGVVRAKGQKKIAFEIDVQFAGQILKSSGNTCIYIQTVDKEHNTGIGELIFQRHTGYTIHKDTRYYGTNNMNLAAALVKPKAEQEEDSTTELMGNGLFIDTRGKCKVSIVDYHLIMKDNGTDLPVFSVGKLYDQLDSYELRSKILNAKVVITDKQNAFIYALMKWTGTGPATLPILESYNNGSPVYAGGWTKVSQKFIPEDVVSGDHTDTNAFTVPADAKQIAMIMYPGDSVSPTILKLKDFEIDVSPQITKTIITNTSHISEESLIREKYAYRSIVTLPNGYAGYRYTVVDTDTKLPIGVVSGGDDKIINDNSWHDAGSTDPDKTQGDFKFLADGKVTMSYTARCFNEQSSLNEVHFKLMKNNGDSTFTDVADSHYASTIAGNTTVAKVITSKQFTFDVKQNETYRFFARSNKSDGFYLETVSKHNPLIRFDIDFVEIEEKDQDVLDRLDFLEDHANEVEFIKDGKTVTNYKIKVDVDTSRITVVKKDGE